MRALLLVALVAAPLAAQPRAAQPLAAPGAGSGAPAGARPRGRIDPEAAPRPAMHAVRTAAPLVVDGRLDEPAWATADSVSDFVQQLPETGMPARFRTVVRVLFDADHLYVGAVNYDPEPRRAIVAGLERDFVSGNSDLFGLTLDTFHDRRNSFLFAVNPAGAVRDEQTFDDSRTVVDAWEGVSFVKTTVQDSSWTVELAIPLRTLRFDPRRPVQEWGVNFIRRVRRVNETSYWAPLERQYRVHRMSKAGTLTGLEGLRQGRNLQLKPYAVAGGSEGAQVPLSQRGGTADVGLDAKYGLTPSLTLDATLNTDFSQVEVDQEQVNLTRFSLLFPERREFFIENAGAFAFGDVQERNYRMGAAPRDFTLFNSRAIGLTGDGRPVPILGGGRVTGRAGAWGVGLLDLRTRPAFGAAGENMAVARLRRNVWGNSDVGVLLADRSGAAPNSSWGVDANLRPIGGLVVNAYAAGSRAPGTAADGTAARTSVAYRGRVLNTSAMWKRVDDGFAPGLGFVRRRGMQQWFGTVGVHARPALRRVQELNPYVDVDYVTDLRQQLDTRTITTGLTVALQPDGELGVEVVDQFDRLERPFVVVAGDTIQPGAYGWREASLRATTAQGRAVYGSASVSGGGFYDGTRRSASGALTWRPRPDVGLEASLQRNDVTRPGGGFHADLAALRLRYARSVRLFGSAFVQYNTQTGALVTNARVNYRYHPLSDVFVVFTERRDAVAHVRNERSVALKVTRMLAF